MSDSVRRQKLLLRKKLREKVALLSAAARRRKSGAILKKLLKNPAFKNAKVIFTYAALPREVQTKALITCALKSKKKVFIPKVNLEKKTLSFRQVRRWSELKKGPFGVLQPSAPKDKKKTVPDLLIVPGLGFDRKGGRIGQGLGFFDRFLERFSKTPSIGLAFREQIVKKIPREKHDLPVDKVITD